MITDIKDSSIFTGMNRVMPIIWVSATLIFSCKLKDPGTAADMNGRLIVHDSFPSSGVDTRPILVWLPPGYTPEKKYAVLYMHDGQMLFDGRVTWTGQEWQVDETMTRLHAEKKIQETLVVGIPNSGAYRWAEYLPQGALDKMPEPVRKEVEHAWLNDRPLSDAYLTFIVKELKPFIDRQYSTRTEPAHTFIMGSSMGGIISLYAICEYPDVFGGAGCLSTHWPLDIPGLDSLSSDFDIPSGFISYLQDHLPSPDNHRIYFDYGTASLDALYKPYQDQVDTLMMRRGYTSKEWMTKVFPGEDHSETAWARRLHLPLEFLLGR